MSRKLTLLALFCSATVVATLYCAGRVRATQANGFKGTTIATGTFGEFAVFNHADLSLKPQVPVRRQS